MSVIEMPPGVERPAPKLDDLTPEQRQAIAELAGENPPSEEEVNQPQGLPATTAFLVIVLPDNQVQISPDCNLDLVLDRYPTPGDLKHGLRETLAQVENAELAGIVVPHTAQAVQQAMIQGAQQMQQIQDGQALASQVGKGFDPRLLKGGF